MRMSDGKPVGEPTLVKRNIGSIVPMGFTRSGSLYYTIGVGGQNVYIATVDPATGELLSPPTKAIRRSEGFNSLPAWSPDGKYLAYLSMRPPPGSRGADRDPVLVIRSMESGEERELHAEVWKAWYLHWSPDGCSILIGQRRKGLDLLDVQTGDETPIARGPVGKSAWSPDGKTIFYIGKPVEIERGVWFSSIVAHDLETGREQELRRDMGGGLGFAISPVGRQLAFFYIRRRVDSGGWSYSIVVHDLGTGREQELRRDICHPREPGVIGIGPDLRISPDGRQLTFSPGDFNTGERLLKVMPTAGGEPRELLRLKDPERFCGSRWTPDGRYILFGTRKRWSPDHPDEPVELWRIPAEGGEPQKLLAMDGLLVIDRLLNLSIHPDGQRIAFTGGKEEAEVWVMENFLQGFTADK
jgi:Tol biopolymer transport system component